VYGLEGVVLSLLKTPRGRIGVGLTSGLIASFFWFLSYPQLASMRQLRDHGVRTLADVIDARISTGGHGFDKSYDIRYRFRLQPQGRWYERSEKGPLARKELWASLPKDEWEQVTQVGRVEVDYLPTDPSVNEIAGKAGPEVGGVYALMCFAGAFALAAGVLIVSGFLKLVRQ